jgi:hypothetical protein
MSSESKSIKIEIIYPEEYEVEPRSIVTDDTYAIAVWMADNLGNWVMDDEIKIIVNDEQIWPK